LPFVFYCATQTSMLLAEFEPATPASGRPHTLALDRLTSGFCRKKVTGKLWSVKRMQNSKHLQPLRVWASSFLTSRDHTQGHTTVARTPLDEWSARRRDLYLTRTTLTTDKHTCPRWDSNPNPSRRSAADRRLRPLGHWDRLNVNHWAG
jgi:hypothetical protein